MSEREKIIRLWFDMWLKKTDHGIMDLFSFDAVYIFFSSQYEYIYFSLQRLALQVYLKSRILYKSKFVIRHLIFYRRYRI